MEETNQLVIEDVKSPYIPRRQLINETKSPSLQRRHLEHAIEIENKEIENRNRYEALMESKKDMEKMNTDKIEQMRQTHGIELERRKQDYSDKMEADALRYQELLRQK